MLSGLSGADPAKSYGNYPLSAMYTSDRYKLPHPETRSNTFQLKSDGGIVTMKSANAQQTYELNNFDQLPATVNEYKTMSSINKRSNTHSRQPNNQIKSQLPPAIPVYIHNKMPSGVHMPSKGLYN